MSDITASEDGQGIDNITKPEFKVETINNQAHIKTNFVVTAEMKGYFLFKLTVSDGQNSNTVDVRVVIIGADDKFTITFLSDKAQVVDDEQDIKTIFDVVFPDWSFQIDNYKEDETKATEETTTIECHYLSNQALNPISKIHVAAEFDKVYWNVTGALSELGLSLHPEQGFDFGFGRKYASNGSDANVLGIIFIILSSILGIMFVFLAIAYGIRVRQ